MIATNHLLASTVITLTLAKSRMPATAKLALGLSAGFGSHLLLDAVPHLEPSAAQGITSYLVFGSMSFWLAATDNILGFILLAYWYVSIPLLRRYSWLLLPCVASAWGPDAVVAGIYSHHLSLDRWWWLYSSHALLHNWWSDPLSAPTIRLWKLTLGSLTSIGFTWWSLQHLWTYSFVPYFGTKKALLPQAIAVDRSAVSS